MNIFRVVEGYGAIIFGDEELSSFITWNGISTFLWWNGSEREGFENTDIMTEYGITNLDHAERVAKQWHAEVEAELLESFSDSL